jgi:hypothetical protein
VKQLRLDSGFEAKKVILFFFRIQGVAAFKEEQEISGL